MESVATSLVRIPIEEIYGAREEHRKAVHAVDPRLLARTFSERASSTSNKKMYCSDCAAISEERQPQFAAYRQSLSHARDIGLEMEVIGLVAHSIGDRAHKRT